MLDKLRKIDKKLNDYPVGGSFVLFVVAAAFIIFVAMGAFSVNR